MKHIELSQKLICRRLEGGRAVELMHGADAP